MPWVILSFANSRRPGKQGPATWVSHSAGFAICSPRGMGEPHDIAPLGSGHLSYSAICARGRRPQGRRYLLVRARAVRARLDVTEVHDDVHLRIAVDRCNEPRELRQLGVTVRFVAWGPRPG